MLGRLNLLICVNVVQECDATEDDSSTAAYQQKTQRLKKLIEKKGTLKSKAFVLPTSYFVLAFLYFFQLRKYFIPFDV